MGRCNDGHRALDEVVELMTTVLQAREHESGPVLEGFADQVGEILRGFSSLQYQALEEVAGRRPELLLRLRRGGSLELLAGIAKASLELEELLLSGLSDFVEQAVRCALESRAPIPRENLQSGVSAAHRLLSLELAASDEHCRQLLDWAPADRSTYQAWRQCISESIGALRLACTVLQTQSREVAREATWGATGGPC